MRSLVAVYRRIFVAPRRKSSCYYSRSCGEKLSFGLIYQRRGHMQSFSKPDRCGFLLNHVKSTRLGIALMGLNSNHVPERRTCRTAACSSPARDERRQSASRLWHEFLRALSLSASDYPLERYDGHGILRIHAHSPVLQSAYRSPQVYQVLHTGSLGTLRSQ